MLFIEEPQRKPREDKPDILRDLGTLSKVKLYRQGVLGCAYTAAIGAFSFWAPSSSSNATRCRSRRRTPSSAASSSWRARSGTIIGGRWADAQSKKIDASFKLDPLNPERSFREQATATRLRRRWNASSTRYIRGASNRSSRSALSAALVGAPLAVACFLPGPDALLCVRVLHHPSSSSSPPRPSTRSSCSRCLAPPRERDGAQHLRHPRPRRSWSPPPSASSRITCRSSSR